MPTLAENQVQAVDELVSEWVFQEPVPGVSVVLVDEDGEQYAEGFGTRDLGTNAPATPDTLFGMGSISKSVTALAVLQLVEDGDLAPDDEVDAYVDALQDVPGDPVTVEDLLTHTSGIPSTDIGTTVQSLEGYPSGIADATDRRRLFRATADRRVTDDERFFYNNAGYGVLGSVVEAVDGRSYETYVAEEILTPLGMDRAGFGDEALADDENAMTPYRPGNPPEEAPSPYDELMHPPGGLVASTRELGRYLRAMMGDGAVDGARVCDPGTVERLQRGRVTPKTRLDGAEYRYGYGWRRTALDDDELVGHAGSVVVTTAFAGYLEDEGLGVVVGCNTSASPGPGALGAAVLAVATGRDRTVVPAYALQAKAEAVAGTYTDYRERTTATVEPDEGGLTMTLEGAYTDEQEVIPLLPESLAPDDHRFYYVDEGGWRTAVEFDVEGDRADLFFDRVRFRREEPGS